MATHQPRTTCRHCGRRKLQIRPRGLCWRCYYTLAIRRRYPTRVNQFCDRPRPATPADRPPTYTPPPPRTESRAEPGTEARVRELQERVRRGEQLFGREDRRRRRRAE